MTKEKIEELRQKLNELYEKKAPYVELLKVSHELDIYIVEEQKKMEKERKAKMKTNKRRFYE